MTTPHQNMPSELLERLATLPEIPHEFGEDGGKFYKYYDELAEEIDEDLVRSLKAQLDGILIFAGLFAGVNSAFLALTLPQMSADPITDTNALLLHLALGDNTTIKAIQDLPSSSFTPPSAIYPINVLFSMSLTLALLSSFLAVLGQQWLVHYRKRSGGGAEHQRWEQLRRYLGAKRWGLELVLDHILPTLLQIGLIMFCISFIMFLGTLSPCLSYVVAAPMGLAAAVVVVTALCAAWDQWCPFKSPLSHAIQLFLPSCFIFLGRVLALAALLGASCLEQINDFHCRFRSIRPVSPNRTAKSFKSSRLSLQSLNLAIRKWLLAHIRRAREQSDVLKAVAIKRVICTSEDSVALVHAAVNLQAYKNPEGLRDLLNDDEFRDRLRNLFHNAHRRRTDSVLRSIEAKTFGNSFLYLVLSVGSVADLFPSEERAALLIQPPNQLYPMELYQRLSGDGRRLTDIVQLFNDSGCSTCRHCAELTFWEQMIGSLLYSSLRGFLPTTYHVGYYSLCDLSEDQVPTKILCLTAWGIIVSKELTALGNHEGGGPDRWYKWYMDKFLAVIELYREAENAGRMCQLIADAVATSDSEWQYRPAVKVYVTLLSRGCVAVSNSGQNSCGVIFASLGTLLIFVEKMIRDPGTALAERDELRGQRRKCFQIFGKELKELGMGIPKRLEIWKTALPSILKYIRWIQTVFEDVPGSHDNRLVSESLQNMLGTLPDVGLPLWLSPETRMEYVRTRSLLSTAIGSLGDDMDFDRGRREWIEFESSDYQSTNSSSATYAEPSNFLNQSLQ